MSQEVTWPSGIKVFYQSEPRMYKVNDVEVPSVTTVLDVLHKGALTWWGMRIGVQGVCKLVERNLMPSEWWHTPEDVEALLTSHKLTVNHVRDQAGDRGTSVHRALEDWADARVIPDPDKYPDNERGYVEGVLKFTQDVRAERLLSEVMVGSAEHAYAGRYDLRAKIQDSELVTSIKRDKREKFPAGTYLLDLKTSKGVYDTHFLQLEAYEQASQECGFPATMGRLVVRVSKDGGYEVHRSPAVFGDFLTVRRVHAALENLKARKKAS